MTESNKNVVATLIFLAAMVVIVSGLTGVVLSKRDASPAKIQAAIAACAGVAKEVNSRDTVISEAALNQMLASCNEQPILAAQKRAAGVPNAPN